MYDLQVYSLKVTSFINGSEFICLPSTIAIVSTQSNGFIHCYLTLIILFNNQSLLTDSKVVTSIVI